MNRKYALTAVILVVSFAFVAFSSFAQESRGVDSASAAREIAHRICLKTDPDWRLMEGPEQYEFLVFVLNRARGIGAFLDKEPGEPLTAGELKEIYDDVTRGVEIVYDDRRAACPVDVARVFSLAPEGQISTEDFNTVVNCFPYCSFDDAETYIPPEAFLPGALTETGDEEPSSQL